MKATARKEDFEDEEPSKPPPEVDQEYVDPGSEEVSDEDFEAEEEEPKSTSKKRKQPVRRKKTVTNGKKKSTTSTTPSTYVAANSVAKSIPQHHTTTIFNKCKVYEPSFNEDYVVFFVKNGTFIENHSNKLLLSSVKHVVTVELPSMENNDELLARIRLVDALSDKEVFCTTSSSSRNKGQRVIFGQTINLFDHNTPTTVATLLEFRFRESTSTNKRPYVMKLEISRGMDLLVCFYTEPFNVVWRDPAKKAKSRKRGAVEAFDEDDSAEFKALELTPYQRPAVTMDPSPKKARIEPPQVVEIQKEIVSKPSPTISDISDKISEEVSEETSPTRTTPVREAQKTIPTPASKKSSTPTQKPTKTSVLNNLANGHQPINSNNQSPYHRGPPASYYAQPPQGYPGYPPGMPMPSNGYYYPAQGAPPNSGSPQQYYSYPPYGYPPAYPPMYGYPPAMMGPTSNLPPQQSPTRKK